MNRRFDDADRDGGQFGVSMNDARRGHGRFLCLRVDCYMNEIAQNSGNTFNSEIDGSE